MTQKELIRQEIERRMEELERDKYINIDAKACRHSELKFLERFLDSLPEEKPSEDLEEAAKEFANQDCVTFISRKKGFIAGAEWMRKKDVEDMYMSDNRHFLKCYEQGKVDMKVEMMKDAVEAKIYGYDDGSFELIASWLDMPNNSIYKDGDKVKIIIVKK